MEGPTPEYIRVAAVQMQVFPAYRSATFSYLHEPTGDRDILTSVSNMSGIIGGLQKNIHSRYLDWLKRRVITIVKSCAELSVDILVFSEYSIPAELLPTLASLSKTHDLHIVAGSHVVSPDHAKIYERLGISRLISPQGTTDPGDVRKAICPLLAPNGRHHVTWKRYRSRWELDLKVATEPWKAHEIEVRGQPLHLAVALCIDAVHLTQEIAQALAQHAHRLIVVPSWSPTVGPFEDFARIQQLLAESAVVYVNDPSAAGTKVYAHVDDTAAAFVENDGSVPLPEGEEGIVIADINPAGQYRKTHVAEPHFPFRLVCVAPLLYRSSGQGEKYGRAVSAYTSSGDDSLPPVPETLPRLARDKLNHLQIVIRGTSPTSEEIEALSFFVEFDEDVVGLGSLKLDLACMCRDELAPLLQGGLESQADILRLGNVYVTMCALAQSARALVPARVLDTRPLLDRDEEFRRINQTFNNRATRILAIQGIRGIGKTAILDEIFRRVLPGRRWKRIAVELTEGTGFPRFIGQVGKEVGVDIRPDAKLSDDADIREIIDGVLKAFDRLPRACMTIDDWHMVMDRNTGRYRDERFDAFLDRVAKRDTFNGNKIVLASRYAVPLDPTRGDNLTVSPLQDNHIKAILQLHIRTHSYEESVMVPDDLVRGLHGNPLAAVIAAQFREKYSLDSLVQNQSIRQRFQERLMGCMLDRIELSQEEQACVEFCSVFNTGMEFDAFQERFGDTATRLVASLCDSFLLEFVGHTSRYRLHPLIREFFYQRLLAEERKELHSRVADYFERKLHDNPHDPEYLGESISHLASAARYEEVQKKKFKYYDELRPVAKRFYDAHDYKRALEYYSILARYCDQDAEIQFQLCLCYASFLKWPEARRHFERTVALRPDAWWVYSEYAYKVATLSRRFPEAEDLLRLAKEGADREQAPPWRYARLYVTYGIIHQRQGNVTEAEQLFGVALNYDPQSASVRYHLARFLVSQGQTEAAATHIEEGLNQRPRHPGLLKLQTSLLGAGKSPEGDPQVPDADFEEPGGDA